MFNNTKKNVPNSRSKEFLNKKRRIHNVDLLMDYHYLLTLQPNSLESDSQALKTKKLDDLKSRELELYKQYIEVIKLLDIILKYISKQETEKEKNDIENFIKKVSIVDLASSRMNEEEISIADTKVKSIISLDNEKSNEELNGLRFSKNPTNIYIFYTVIKYKMEQSFQEMAERMAEYNKRRNTCPTRLLLKNIK